MLFSRKSVPRKIKIDYLSTESISKENLTSKFFFSSQNFSGENDYKNMHTYAPVSLYK